MSTHSTMTELRNLPAEELSREVRNQRMLTAKLRLAVELQKEKDSAKYRRERRQLARMMMVLEEKNPKSPRNPGKPTNTISAVPSVSSVSSSKKSRALSKPTEKATLPRHS